MKPRFESLESEVLSLCDKCGSDEARDLSSKHDTLKQGYQHLLQLLQYRVELCQQWTKYAAVAKQCKAQLRALQAKMAAGDLSQAELDSANQELADLKNIIGGWDDRRRDLDQLMVDAEMTIKDRSSQRAMHFQNEIQELLKFCDKTAFDLREKQGQLDELSKLWALFEEKRRNLAGTIENIEQQVDGAKVKDSSLQGVKDMSEEVKAIEKELESHQPEYKEFRDLGRQLVAADATNSNVAQEVMGK